MPLGKPVPCPEVTPENQDRSLPLIVIKDCNRAEINFSVVHGQNCMIDASSSAQPNVFIVHGCHFVLYGYNSNVPPYSTHMFYVNNLTGSFSDSVVFRLLDKTISGERILFVSDSPLFSRKFNICGIDTGFPSQNYKVDPPYHIWGSPSLGSTLWFGRRYNRIPALGSYGDLILP